MKLFLHIISFSLLLLLPVMANAENIQYTREALTTAKQQKVEQQRLAAAERSRLAELEAQRKEEQQRLAEEKIKAEQQSQNHLAGEMISIPGGPFRWVLMTEAIMKNQCTQ